MEYFEFRDNALFAEEVKVSDIIKKVPTPFYLYSKLTFLRHFNQIKDAFKEVNPLIAYSVKSNSNLSILKLLKKEGSGFDIVSGGELYRVLKIKAKPEKIVFAGVAKTDEEIYYALKNNILFFNTESLNEISAINKIANQMNKIAQIAVRINPDVDADTHKHITTGKKETKFGISIYEIKKIIKRVKESPNIDLKGIHFHIGSQITHVEPYVKSIKKILSILPEFKKAGINIKYLNIGGGLGIIYNKEKPATPYDFAKKIIPLIKKSNLKLIMEPGRYISGNSGILITKVIFIKKSLKKNFIIVDAGMNTLIRPTLYEAFHKIIPVTKRFEGFMKADIVGPICETGDVFAKNRKIEVVREGDYLAVMSAGAYGMVMASRYNSRFLPAEVLVENKKFKIIRKPETYKDLIRNEIIK